MRRPEIESLANCLKFHWGEGEGSLTATVTEAHVHRDGHTSANLLITTTAPGFDPHIVADTLNLSSKIARSRLAKELMGRYDHVDWDSLLEYVSVLTIRHVQQGDPVTELIRKPDEMVRPQWALYPLLPLNQPTVLFGDGGVGKGQIALLLANCLRGVYDDNPWGFWRGDLDRTPRILYLDYETEREEVLLRQECLCAGLQLPTEPSLLYRRQYLLFADDIGRLQSLILEQSITTIIVDSIGAACGAELNSSETALRFFSALRSLRNVTSILIAHTSKSDDGAKTPYGSAFFRNYARSVWEVRKSQDTDSRTISAGLFNRKSNNSRLHAPIGVRFDFESDDNELLQVITAAPEDVKTVAEFLDRLHVKDQLDHALQHGPLTVRELCDSTTLKPSTVRGVLNRYRDKRFNPVGSARGDDQKWSRVTVGVTPP